MVIKTVSINNNFGLYAKPATFFIQKANEFKCSIWVEKNDRKVNAKSLLGVLTLCISADDTIRVEKLIAEVTKINGRNFTSARQ